MDCVELFKCLSDGSRIRIIRDLQDGPKYVELISERLALTPSTVSFHLKKMVAVGLVSARKDQYYTMYSLNENVIDQSIKDTIDQSKPKDAVEQDREELYRQKVVGNFFENGMLKAIPAQHKKRIIVLEEILKDFEFDRKYSEKEVNSMIAVYFDDFCTIRREFIDFHLMDREKGEYWRI